MDAESDFVKFICFKRLHEGVFHEQTGCCCMMFIVSFQKCCAPCPSRGLLRLFDKKVSGTLSFDALVNGLVGMSLGLAAHAYFYSIVQITLVSFQTLMTLGIPFECSASVQAG